MNSKQLTAKARKRMSAGKFALRRQKKYAVDTPKRAGSSKAAATRQYKSGGISLGTKRKIHSRANQVLRRAARKTSRKRKRS